MAEAGEGQPKRCQCGFWGSPNTMDLCSKCYKDHLQKSNSSQSNGGSPSSGKSGKLLKQKQMFPVDTPEKQVQEETSERLERTEDGEEMTKEGEEMREGEEDVFLPTDRPVQKNKKRCWVCKTKLELAQRELGGCKCGYVFCFMHRLPEQHDCIYDHKEGGRKRSHEEHGGDGEKKIGRSFHRMDSRPE